ncbi:hypothetical protein ACFU93_28310 [Streptomyces sp. NPDC057611]|uniref:hypothetical protein n=1 Tax=Streptomyces sp. NPDC057611 TaxID=3346182 RepID=UPI0036C457AF
MASKNKRRRGQVGPTVPAKQSNSSSGPDGSLWMRTRSGARAGRGFHYQDAVGAWLCGRVLSRALVIDRIVPEGFEDLSCEGPTPWHVQVKSRQEGSWGHFGSRLGADFNSGLPGRRQSLAAPNGMWRALHAVVVGDPLQLAPVVVLLWTAQRALREEDGMGWEWPPSRTSVQQLADRTNHYGTLLPAELPDVPTQCRPR